MTRAQRVAWASGLLAGALLIVPACGRSELLPGASATSAGSECPLDQTGDIPCLTHDPNGKACAGHAHCDSGLLSACLGSEEICDGIDNDCNGIIDDGFVDPNGSYTVNDQHCGQCALDCTVLASEDGLPLRCGGDPATPHCVLACADPSKPLTLGDHVDADGDPANGCECVFVTANDEPGPSGETGLDENCDGADGVVTASLYVAPDGDDSALGTPLHPLRTISEGIRRSAASLGQSLAKSDIFVAAGSYSETLTLQDGVRLHGGYRRDFLALDVQTERVEVRAPSGGSGSTGGAALIARNVGITSTLVEGMAFVGADAETAGVPAIGVVISNPGPSLALRQLEVSSGTTVPGTDGTSGTAGAPPSAATLGDPARPAVEDSAHQCQSFDPNLVAGGFGGKNVCAGVNVAGGDGGISHCPHTTGQNVRGVNGLPSGDIPGGLGGDGGSSREGPVLGSNESGCMVGVCCSGSYISLPFSVPGPGGVGHDGTLASDGVSCSDALGSFVNGTWRPGFAANGAPGSAGSGGGGGGSGSGLLMDWAASYASFCGYPDGLGGGGGGGGAGGCGGGAGQSGASAAPTIAVLLSFSGARAWPTLEGSLLAPAGSGNGGRGGLGGAGAPGGEGETGTALAPELAQQVPYSGTQVGARGGNGGNGSNGGTGGGGCGGAVVGLWIAGASGVSVPGTYTSANQLVLGAPGRGGRSGGADENGADGGAFDVVVR